MTPMIKLLSQFEQVANATPFALSEEGKISDGRAQGTFRSQYCLFRQQRQELEQQTGVGRERNILHRKMS